MREVSVSSAVARYLFLELGRAAEDEEEAAVVGALRGIVEAEDWNIHCSANTYGLGAHENLYNNESPTAFRTWLTSQGIGPHNYGEVVGSVQYRSIDIRSTRFPAQSANRGWRIRLMGFPSIKLAAVGLATHYQGTQNHNEMGRASALLHQAARNVLDERLKVVFEGYPAAQPQDWDERGLMSAPILRIGALDLSSFENGQGVRLRMVRNTTVKKELSAFFAIRGLSSLDDKGELEEVLMELRDVGAELSEDSND